MQHDVYDYTAHTVSKNTVLQKLTACSGCPLSLRWQVRHLPPA